jgi:quercetin dioxygenase-like cupin family protein
VGTYGRSTVGAFKIHSDYNGFKVDVVSRKPADVEVLQLTIAPGGTTGWHAHPAPVFVIVTAGALTVYEADENPCTPTVYPAGTGFVETGGSVHVARNDGSVNATPIATSLAPVGAATLIDAPQPSHCPF